MDAHEAAFAVAYLHRVRFTSGTFDVENPVLSDVLAADGTPARVVVFVDDGVVGAWPDLDRRINRYATKHGDRIVLTGSPHVVPGGEAAKNDWSVFEAVARGIDAASICRQSYCPGDRGWRGAGCRRLRGRHRAPGRSPHPNAHDHALTGRFGCGRQERHQRLRQEELSRDVQPAVGRDQ